MKCPNCGEYDALDCGHGHRTPDTPNGPSEYNCDFWWNDTLLEVPDCEDCPLIWCKNCRDELLVDAVAFRDASKRGER